MKKRLVKKNVKKVIAKTMNKNIVVNFDNDFQYEPETRKISISTTIKNADFSDLENLVKKLGYNGNAKITTIAFLHELGHYFTYESFTKEQDDYDTKVRAILEKAFESKNEKIVNKAMRVYYNLPQEIVATQFAVEYATKFPKETKMLEKALDI